MNQIPKNQNKQSMLDHLFSQRVLYSSAKKYFGYRTSIALLFAIFGPIIAANTTIGAYLAIAAVVYILIDHIFLEKTEENNKKDAAKIQELFDTEVLEVHWNNIVAGKKPDMEIIGKILSENPKRDYSKLRDWYAKDVGQIDISLARFLCQRSNVWWDTTLRKRYLYLLYILSFSVLVVLVILGTSLNLALQNFFLGIVLPMIPLMELLIKQIKGHFDSACCITDLKENLDDTINRILAGETIDSPETYARIYQDEIYRHRSKCPMVFDWVYWLFRKKQETQMQFSVESKVKEYLKNS